MSGSLTRYINQIPTGFSVSLRAKNNMRPPSKQPRFTPKNPHFTPSFFYFTPLL